jgi:dsDNA-specific endonuclease/ATPase MutS2
MVGFNFIMEKLDVITPYGINQKKNIKPFRRNEKYLLMKELENIQKIIESIKNNNDIYKSIDRIFYKFKDIRNSIERCKNLNTLDEVELYELKYFSMLMEELINLYKKLNLNIENIKFNSVKSIIDLLDPEEEKISTFYIYDSYSENLKKIREEKRKIEEKIFIEEDKEKVNILKEDRLDIVLLEEKEELKIKKYLSNEIYNYLALIKKNIDSLGKLDLLIGKGKLAINYNGVKPKICDDMKIEFKECFNPYIKEILKKRKKDFIPISISLHRGTSVITGANMGGKSVTLNTIVLNLLLGQMGFFIFSKEAVFPILDFIYFISDDMQSISKGLSTFGAEIIKLKQIIECIKRENGFIALDEFARGTNPKEGYFLVKALCKYLKDFNSISLITTHYDGVVDDDMVHYQVIGLKNVDFDSLKLKIDLNKTNSIEIIQEHMDYRLEKLSKENKVPKDALNISILLGLEDSIVNIVKNYYEEGESYE